MKISRSILAALLATVAGIPLLAHAQAVTDDPFEALAFLEGTWEASVDGTSGVASVGHYRFGRELGGHVLVRHAVATACKGPGDFDCDHGDVLYVFQDAPAQPLKAIYFDNEGHVIHYAVSAPAPDQVVFLSEPGPGPTFRLGYVRDGSTMRGKFEMRVPGREDWRSYLEWHGAREQP